MSLSSFRDGTRPRMYCSISCAWEHHITPHDTTKHHRMLSRGKPRGRGTHSKRPPKPSWSNLQSLLVARMAAQQSQKAGDEEREMQQAATCLWCEEAIVVSVQEAHVDSRLGDGHLHDDGWEGAHLANCRCASEQTMQLAARQGNGPEGGSEQLGSQGHNGDTRSSCSPSA